MTMTNEQAEAVVVTQAPQQLEIDERGDITVYVVWSIKPGRPLIVAICTSEEIAKRYRPFAEQHHQGVFYVEPVLLDHAFGRRDLQSAIYATAIRKDETNANG